MNRRLESRTRRSAGACILAGLALACASAAFAQPRPRDFAGPAGTLTGHITRSDGPKYDVRVMDQVTWMSVTAGQDGSFRFERLPVGEHLIRVVSDYCDVQLVPVIVRESQVSTLDLRLDCKPRPCPHPDRADRTCILENPDQRARVGTTCEVHRHTKLKLDLVSVHYGIVGYTPGLGGDERARFPNAYPWWSAGCVDFGQRWAEVAYCSDCRAVYRLQRLLFRAPRNR